MNAIGWGWLRGLFVVFGAPLLLLALLQAGSWMHTLLRDPEPIFRPLQPIEHPNYRVLTEQALRAFHALPERRQSAIVDELQATITPAGDYLERLARQPPELLCLGENHDDYSRDWLARELLPRYPLNVLMLESGADKLAALQRRVTRGEHYVPLLGADIAGTLKVAQTHNPQLVLEAVDLPAGARGSQPISRDQFIAARVIGSRRAGGTHLVLLGALHCADNPGWLYRTLSMGGAGENYETLLNLRLLGMHQEGPGEAFVRFLDRIGLRHRDLAVTDTRRLPLPVQHWFSNFDALRDYRALLIYRARPRA